MAPVLRVPDVPDASSELDDMPVEDLPVNNGGAGSSSDSEEELSNDGYQLLPQEPEAVNNFPDSMADPDEEQATSAIIHNHFVEALESESASTELEKSIEMESNDSKPMDLDHAETIKAAMAGFSLPTSNLPAWASVIPEEEWKSALIAQLKTNKSAFINTTIPSSSIDNPEK